MERKSGLSLAAGIATGAVLLALDALAERKKEIVELEQYMPASPEWVIDLIMQVEREPEFIPIISGVKILGREPKEVTYEVQAARLLPLSVRYRKWREGSPPVVRWTTVRGAFGFREDGEITFKVQGRGCVARLRSEHLVDAPIAGRFAGPAATGVIRPQLREWLRRLSETLEKEVA